MEASSTWRELLATIIADPREKQRIAEALGIHPMTLVRWARGEVSPRPNSLYRLLDVVPAYRARLLPLIDQAAEGFSSAPPAAAPPQDIPVTLYNHVLHLNSAIPDAQRFWS